MGDFALAQDTQALTNLRLAPSFSGLSLPSRIATLLRTLGGPMQEWSAHRNHTLLRAVISNRIGVLWMKAPINNQAFDIAWRLVERAPLHLMHEVKTKEQSREHRGRVRDERRAVIMRISSRVATNNSLVFSPVTRSKHLK